MTPAFVFDSLRRRGRTFRRAKAGNVILTFALSFIPMVAMVGAAVDYSRGNNAKVSMQAAIDATGLMLSKDVSTLNAQQLSQRANDQFRALINRTDIQNLVITPTYTSSVTDGYQLTVVATGQLPVTFMRVLGRDTLDLDVNTLVKWGNTRLRVALVLDNTGSMGSSNKLTALQTATNNLIDQLKNAAKQNGDIYVSIIPFVKDVNADPTNYTQTWIDWTDWEAPPANSTPPANVGPGSNCPWTNSNNGFRCTNGPANGSANTNTIPSNGTYKGYICPSIDNGSKNALKASVYYNGCYNSTCTGGGNNLSCQHAWVKNARSTWTGCVVDRGNSGAPSSSNYDTNVVTPTTSNTATLFAAEQYTSCPQKILPLSYDWTAMKTLVNNMVAAGNTNQGIGLQHGWMSLVGGGPYPTPPVMDPTYQYKQVIIILLTDGLNTQDRWYTTDTQIDPRQQMTCDNINAAGITLYTVQVNTAGDPTSTLLQNCAGTGTNPKKYPDPDKFFLLTSSTQIVTTFNQIATNLANLYLAR